MKLDPNWQMETYDDHPIELLSLEEVIALPDNIEHTRFDPPGIYFLLKGGEIVYVGKSDALSRRMAQHWQNRRFRSEKDWDAERYLICNDYDNHESRYINCFKPRYNVIYKG